MRADLGKAANAVTSWWRALHLDFGTNRASRARLRRCSTILDALLLPETQTLIRSVRNSRAIEFFGEIDQRLAVLGLILAQVESSASAPFAEQLGRTAEGRPPRSDERPRLSPNRFGTIVRSARARDWDAFARATRRALAVANNPAFNVHWFANDLLFFNDRVLQTWTFHYWQSNAPTEASDTNLAMTEAI
jgi:CRISPR type I-E-associated protein CasB/Cse2